VSSHDDVARLFDVIDADEVIVKDALGSGWLIKPGTEWDEQGFLIARSYAGMHINFRALPGPLTVLWPTVPVDTGAELFVRAFHAAMRESGWQTHPNDDRLREIYRREATK